MTPHCNKGFRGASMLAPRQTYIYWKWPLPSDGKQRSRGDL